MAEINILILIFFFRNVANFEMALQKTSQQIKKHQETQMQMVQGSLSGDFQLQMCMLFMKGIS